MGVNAKFIADFESFYAAVQKAEVSLRSFETGSAKVETSLNRMANSLSGTKLIQDATIMAQAVEQIGGTSKLTTNELAGLGSKANEAVEKMKRLGIEVPPGLQAIALATNQATHETTGLTGIVERLTERFIVYETLRHIFDFAKDAIESTARIEDLAKATGLSTDAIQRFSYVGKAFGVDSEQMARGVEQLSAKLVNDKGAIAAVNALGLSVKDLIAVGPEEAFLRIAESVGHVESPMLKGGLAADLFGGKLAKVLLPALTDLRKAINDVPQDAVISDINVQRAHDFEVGLDRLITRFKAWTFVVAEYVANSEHQHAATKKVAEDIKLAADATDAAAASTRAGAAATTGAITAADLMRNTLESWKKDALDPLTDAQLQGINVGLQYGKSTAEIAKAIGVSEIAVHQYVKASEEQLEMYDATIESAKKEKAIMDELNDKTFVLAMERKRQLREETTRTTTAVNAAFLAEFDAQVKLNAEYGRAADGELKVSSAAETLRQALDRLHATKLEGISQSKQEQALIDQFTRSLYEEATANDALVKAATTTFAVVGHGVETYGAATQALGAMHAEFRHGITDIDEYNKAITAFYDRFVGIAGGVGNLIGVNTVNAPSFLDRPGPRAPSIRDSGGPVTGGQSYLIGMNRQPELFTPGANGFVTPMGSGTPIVNNFYVNGSVRDMARPLMDELTRLMKQSRLFPAA